MCSVYTFSIWILDIDKPPELSCVHTHVYRYGPNVQIYISFCV